MKRSAFALGLFLLPATLFAQTETSGDPTKLTSPNCKWLAMQGITPDLNITDFLDQTITGDWMTHAEAGLVHVPGKAAFGIAQVPAEVITVVERNNRYYARNKSGDAEVALEAMLPDAQSDMLSGDPLANPFGAVRNVKPVVDPEKISFESGCDLTDLPMLKGTGQWSVPDGKMDVTLYMVPTGPNDLHVVMIGQVTSEAGMAEIRRGYSMHRLEVVPLTD